MNPFPGASIDVIVWMANEHRKEQVPLIPPSLSDILEEVCDIFSTPIDGVIGDDKTEENVRCRRIYCYMAMAITSETALRIGKFIGYLEHSAVLHHRTKVKEWLRIKEPKFLIDWDKYTSESRIYKKHFKQ